MVIRASPEIASRQQPAPSAGRVLQERRHGTNRTQAPRLWVGLWLSVKAGPGGWITAESLRLETPLGHLYRFFFDSGWIVGLEGGRG